jgi:hypothetical protein
MGILSRGSGVSRRSALRGPSYAFGEVLEVGAWRLLTSTVLGSQFRLGALGCQAWWWAW